MEKLKFGYKKFEKAGKVMYWTLPESVRRAFYKEIQSPKLRDRLMSLPNILHKNASIIAEKQRRAHLRLDQREAKAAVQEITRKLNKSTSKARVVATVRHKEANLSEFQVSLALSKLADSPPGDYYVEDITKRCAARLFKRSLQIIKTMRKMEVSASRTALGKLAKDDLVWFPHNVQTYFLHWEDKKYAKLTRNKSYPITEIWTKEKDKKLAEKRQRILAMMKNRLFHRMFEIPDKTNYTHFQSEYNEYSGEAELSVKIKRMHHMRTLLYANIGNDIFQMMRHNNDFETQAYILNKYYRSGIAKKRPLLIRFWDDLSSISDSDDAVNTQTEQCHPVLNLSNIFKRKPLPEFQQKPTKLQKWFHRYVIENSRKFPRALDRYKDFLHVWSAILDSAGDALTAIRAKGEMDPDLTSESMESLMVRIELVVNGFLSGARPQNVWKDLKAHTELGTSRVVNEGEIAGMDTETEIDILQLHRNKTNTKTLRE
ncbi:hypothetical protein AAMO2058_000043700 [Amorphochlora amoebiformis]